MSTDPAADYAALRTETSEMFGYDLANLSLTQGLQLDLVSLLRLEVDTMQGQVLAGDTVDLNRLVTAHAMLQKMLPERSLVAPAPAPEARFGNEHRARLRDLIERTVLASTPDEDADTMQREEAAAVAAALPIDTAQAAPVAPSPPPSARADNVVPIDGTARANANRPPDHYLKDGGDHHVERGGESMLPYRRDRWSPPFGW
jgi:hypothetical protein